MAFAAMLSVGVVSCDKENNENENQNENVVGWVDLGLPSGLLWAECNLGANAPEEYGNYYAWGETEPKESYNNDNYKYGTYDGNSELLTLTKYNTDSEYGPTDNLTILQAMDDAATAALAGGARTPTKEEWEELINNTTSEWTTVNGVKGNKLTAANGNSIFLPAAGLKVNSMLVCDGSGGFYWTSSLDTEKVGDAFYGATSSSRLYIHIDCRYGGHTVRAVRQN